MTMMTGHLAMFQIVTTVSPTPTASPMALATLPLETTARVMKVSSRTPTMVTRICSGRRM